MRGTLIFLPLVAYILLTLIFSRWSKTRNVLEAFVKGHLVLFTFIAISTELLSLMNEVTFSSVLLGWLFLLMVIFISLSQRRRINFSWMVLNQISPITGIFVGVIALILLTTFITAIIYPPNTWDSMTYHMPRVLHWINNNNISFYPTEIARQNYQMPLAEFAIMHLQILTGGDWYANLVQWISFLVLICLGAVVAAELGFNKKLQLISATITATLPMAILQASSTQNDLVVSVFLMSFVLFMLRLRMNFCIENLLFAAISLGLALLTKGTAYIYAAAFGVSLVIPLVLNTRTEFSNFIKTASALTLIVIIALALNTGHFWRNYQLYGHPLSTEGSSYLNQDMSLTTVESNILRNVALHLGTPYEHVNEFQMQMLNNYLGSNLNDPKTTWAGSTFKIPYNNHEDWAGNLVHMVLIIICAVILFILWWQGRHRNLIWYGVGILTGTVLYCWLLKWQPWASRLHTPLFVMTAPLLAIVITSGATRQRTAYLICILLIFYSVPFALNNPSRSLVSQDWKSNSRIQLYFQNKPYLFSEYKWATNILGGENHGEVGLYMGMDDWEYPIWVLGNRQEKNERPVKFRSVGVNNTSRVLDENGSLPTHVIATKPIESWKYAPKYESIYVSNSISVYRLAENSELTRMR